MSRILESLIQECQVRVAEDYLSLSSNFYISNEVYQLERQVIESNWQLVGHHSQLNQAGDHIVAEINQKPIIVVLNKNNELNAFYNVCQHRGGPLAYCNGHSNMLTCKYHGWTYTLDGQLKAAPEMRGNENFSVKSIYLKKVHVTTWHGLIFVNLSDEPAQDINDMLSGIAANILPIELETMNFSHSDTYEIDCNWKVYIDNYLEGYHIPHIHPELNKILDYRSYQTHCYKWYSYQFSPMEIANTENSPYQNGTAHYYFLWPNMMLNIMPRRLQTNLVVPIGINKCLVIFDYFYSDLDSEATQSLIQRDKAFSDEVQKEDIDICERVQKGLLSGAYQQGVLCKQREQGVFHFQNLLRQSLLDKLT